MNRIGDYDNDVKRAALLWHAAGASLAGLGITRVHELHAYDRIGVLLKEQEHLSAGAGKVPSGCTSRAQADARLAAIPGEIRRYLDALFPPERAEVA